MLGGLRPAIDFTYLGGFLTYLSLVRHHLELRIAELPAGTVAVEDGRPFLAGEPLVTPAPQDEQYVAEFGALLGEGVLITRRALRVSPPLQHPALEANPWVAVTAVSTAWT